MNKTIDQLDKIHLEKKPSKKVQNCSYSVAVEFLM